MKVLQILQLGQGYYANPLTWGRLSVTTRNSRRKSERFLEVVMATFSQVGSGAIYTPRATREAFDREIIERFLNRAAALGIHPTPLSLRPLRKGLFGIMYASDVYRVSWSKEVSISIPGLLSFTLGIPRSGAFVKYNANKVLMSVGGGGPAPADVHPVGNWRRRRCWPRRWTRYWPSRLPAAGSRSTAG